MGILIEFLVVFILVYLAYLLFVILRKKQVNKIKNNTFYKYLVKVYHLDEKKLDLKHMAHIIALSNAFIIATTYTAVMFVKGFIVQVILAICIFILLDLIIYHIVGKILQRGEKNV